MSFFASTYSLLMKFCLGRFLSDQGNDMIAVAVDIGTEEENTEEFHLIAEDGYIWRLRLDVSMNHRHSYLLGFA